MRILLVTFLALLLGACGFHLRAQATLPFETLYVEGSGNSTFVNELKRAVQSGSSTRLVDAPGEAQAVLQVMGETRQKNILSLSGGGRVREYQLIYQINFRLHDGKGKELMPVNSISLKRDISFNDAQLLAKESEEVLLYRDMQSDAVQQIFRRLRVAKLN